MYWLTYCLSQLIHELARIPLIIWAVTGGIVLAAVSALPRPTELDRAKDRFEELKMAGASDDRLCRAARRIEAQRQPDVQERQYWQAMVLVHCRFPSY
ncbi:hypothetical protein AAG607_12170 [Citromicrobium bathyomarinum]|uniref:hypothetical protein n=1 Tax=Citromicrobium bathyomarinum TaxID=72174 RepID=UPI00315A2279